MQRSNCVVITRHFTSITNYPWPHNFVVAKKPHQFKYGYDSAGEITQWQQQQNGNNLCYNLGYDLAGQLTSASAGSGSFQSPPANEYYYSYDPGANRTAVQTTSLRTLRIGGSGLAGGTTGVSYTVLSGDTLASIAQGWQQP